MTVQHRAGLLCILTLQILVGSDGSCVFKLKMNSYAVSNERDWYGNCCDTFAHMWCSSQCDPRFTFCIDHSSGNNSPTDCRYRKLETAEFLDQNSINFNHDMNGVENPIQMNFVTWPGALKFKILVEDDDSWKGGSHPHEKIDTFVISLRLQPARSSAEAYWRRTLRSGLRTKTTPTSLSFEHLLYCDDNYYGADCGTYCRARDDRLGHYTCHPDTGAKICIRGWEGLQCNIFSNDCISHECKNGATCKDGRQTYTCICPAGFRGKKCEINVDECESAPCLNDGNCTDLVNNFTCDCPDGYLGVTCSYHVCSLPTTCLNGGVCVDDGKCACPAGFIGKTCENEICKVFPCYNNATCEKGTCFCPDGYTGTRCEMDLCSFISCHNDANCTNGICRCMPGYRGRHCEFDIDNCVSKPCHHHSLCTSQHLNYTCLCNPGFKGRQCESEIVPTWEKEEQATQGPANVIDVAPFTVKVAAVHDEDQSPVVKSRIATWILALIAALVILLVIVIIIASILIYYRRRVRSMKKKVESLQGNSVGDGNFDNPAYGAGNLSDQNNLNEHVEGSSPAKVPPDYNNPNDPVFVVGKISNIAYTNERKDNGHANPGYLSMLGACAYPADKAPAAKQPSEPNYSDPDDGVFSDPKKDSDSEDESDNEISHYAEANFNDIKKRELEDTVKPTDNDVIPEYAEIKPRYDTPKFDSSIYDTPRRSTDNNTSIYSTPPPPKPVE